ncbi:MAG TPA: hypothetical protein EYG03_08690 [Planctomycetes bacterium]|nr:hypothetical protein [Fuerstiella sp.]HIK92043.1 hypothetical protein [Planctomycetota bacterium]
MNTFRSVPHNRAEDRRRGALLLEVMIALFVFMLAATSLSSYLTNALRGSRGAMSRAEAAMLGEARLNQLLAERAFLSVRDQGDFENVHGWSWSYSVADTNVPELQVLTVTVTRTRQPHTQWSLSQMFRRMTAAGDVP